MFSTRAVSLTTTNPCGVPGGMDTDVPVLAVISSESIWNRISPSR